MIDQVADAVPDRLGDFEIVRLLGAGGSGQVFEARWGPRRVALKVLRADLLPAASERERFFTEARLLAEIGHPGIVKILSAGELPDGRPYLAMELLDGEVLTARLARGPIPLAVAVELLGQLAEALDALHQRGLIHRDLKPENVLVVASRYAVLLDFGIAKSIDAPASTTTQEGGVRGTPAYMAPERFFGQAASVASDVYELAVLFYNMVVGSLPWDSGLDPEDRLNPQRPGDRGRPLPPELETAMMRGLSTRPEGRPASAGALAASIRAGAGAGAAAPAAAERTTAPMAPLAGGPAREGTNHLTYAEQVGPTASVTAGPRSRRRPLFLVVAAILAAAGVAAAFLLWPRSAQVAIVGDEVAGLRSAGRQLEWGADRLEVPPPPRREGDDSGLPRALRHHPADTAVVLGLRARELRQSPAFARIIDAEKQRGALATLVAATRLCELDAIDDVDWISVGLGGAGRDQADLILSGNFTREQIEGCLGKTGASLGSGFKTRRRGSITEITDGPAPWRILWLDDRTLMLSTRAAADAAWFAAREKGEDPVTGEPTMAAGLAAVDREATLWLVGQPDSLDVGAELQGLPVPELLSGHLAVSDRIELAAVMRYPDATRAAEARDRVAAKVAELERDPMAASFFESLSTEIRDRDVHLAMTLGPIATQLVAAALVEAIRKAAQ
jgi:serine/threonine-protein kinase